LLRDEGGSFGTKKEMPEAAERHRVGDLGIETRRIKEGVERNGGTCRY